MTRRLRRLRLDEPPNEALPVRIIRAAIIVIVVYLVIWLWPEMN